MSIKIETSVDRLVALVNQKKNISVSDAAKILKVGEETIEEWANFLEEGGIINIKYNFTKPFLVQRKITPKEAEEKKKDFQMQRDAFVRKVSSSYWDLASQKEEIDSVKNDFAELRKLIGNDFAKTKTEALKTAEKGLKKAELEENEAECKIASFEKELICEDRKYKKLLESIREEEAKLSISKAEQLSMLKRFKSSYDTIASLKGQMKLEERNSEHFVKQIDAFQAKIEKIREILAEKEKVIGQLIERASKTQAGAKLAEEEFKSQEKKEKKLKVGEASVRLNRILAKKKKLELLIDTIEVDIINLENDLKDLIKKARIAKITSNEDSLQGHIDLLQDVFKGAKLKKEKIKKEVNELSRMIK